MQWSERPERRCGVGMRRCPGLSDDDFVFFMKKKKRNFDYENHHGFPELLTLDLSNNPQLSDVALRR
jgi:hypothetical protein